MSDDDYHGVKTLLSNIAAGPLADLTSLTDPIVSQVNIGTVVKIGDGEAGVSAFGTILNLARHSTNPGMSAIQSLLKEFSKKNPKFSKRIANITSDECCTGILLKERLINFPPELAPNIHKVLVDDVKWSSSDDYEPDEGEKREDYSFEYILLLSSFEVEGSSKTTDNAESSEQSPEGIGLKKKRKLEKQQMKASRVYLHWEDEMFMERAIFSHSWQNSSKPVVVRSNRKYQSFHTLFCLRWSDYMEMVDRLAQAI